MQNKMKKISISSTFIKSVLFLFLLVSFPLVSDAQVITVTNASSVSANDGQAIIQIIPGIGDYTYYWENLSTGNPASGPVTTVSLSDTFFNAPSGTYTVSVIDNGSTTFFSDTLLITAPGGSFTYSGDMGLCGTTNTNITAFLNGCNSLSPNLGVNYILSDLSSNILLDTTLVSDSISLYTHGK